MATATSSRRARRVRRPIPWAVAAVLLAVIATLAVTLAQDAARAPAAKPGPFGWLDAAGAPRGWSFATTPSGAAIAYPPGWHAITSDGGSVSAAPAGPDGAFRGYLNATPLGGRESLANWSRFRPAPSSCTSS